MMQTVAFGYRCQECGQGTVEERLIPEYHTKIKGYPFVVRGARVGLCDVCGAEHFAAQETDRWERMFEEEHARHFLTPTKIQGLRNSLGLSKEQFAFLIGCTRQSLHNWERADRSRTQSRMADLLMKLVHECYERGKVDVIRLLTQEAEQFGIRIQFRGASAHSSWGPIVLHTTKASYSALIAGVPELALAADTEGEEQQVIVLSPESDEPVGRLFYDFHTASLKLELTRPLGIDRFEVEVRFADGSVEKSKAVQVENRQVTLLGRTRHTEEEVNEVVLLPCDTKTEVPGEGR